MGDTLLYSKNVITEHAVPFIKLKGTTQIATNLNKLSTLALTALPIFTISSTLIPIATVYAGITTK